MINVTVETKEVEMMLAAVSYRLTPFGMSAWLGKVMGPYIQSRARDRFMQEGDDVSGPWAPLREVTQNIRAESTDIAVGPDHPINKRTGELEEYVIGSAYRFWPTALGGTLRYPAAASGKKSVREKMKTAQLGRAKPKTVPRPVLGFNESDMLFFQAALSFFITGSGVQVGAGGTFK